MSAADTAGDPPPMTVQDLDDWAYSVDSRSNANGPGGETPDSVINAGQAIVDALNARKGRA